eukprot:9024205-Alexandrium_andersonii.AAC.1
MPAVRSAASSPMWLVGSSPRVTGCRDETRIAGAPARASGSRLAARCSLRCRRCGARTRGR